MNRLFTFSKKDIFSIKDFYRKDYKIFLDNKILEITGRNAKVVISIEKEIFTKKQYKFLEKSLESNIRVAGLYSKYDENKSRAPKGYTRKMLCYGLYLLLEHGLINLNDIISIEADPSPNNNLVNKVYIPMGFEMVAKTSETITGGLMKSNVKRILSWCNKTYSNE